MKNKGEMLIESLLSLVIISLALIPISNALGKTSKTKNRINIAINKRIKEKNKLEEIKSLNYSEFLSYVRRDRDVTYKKTSTTYSLFTDESIYIIKVGEYEDVYIP